MIVYINRKVVNGPWGGGSKVLRAIIDALNRRGHQVMHTLTGDIDVVFCFDPRQGSDPDQLSFEQIVTRIAHNAQKAHKRVRLLQRVGDLGTHGKPELLEHAIECARMADAVIFPSAWAYDAFYAAMTARGFRQERQWHVIPNAPEDMFQRVKSTKSVLPSSLSFVTHHWSMNPLKGFDFYLELKEWCDRHGHRFTYVGRDPTGRLDAIGPLAGPDIAYELLKHDVYVTASQFEAGANHVLEAAAVGLPILYAKNGGSIDEYCRSFGFQFDGTLGSFEMALSLLRGSHGEIVKGLNRFKRTIADSAQTYVEIMEGLCVSC